MAMYKIPEKNDILQCPFDKTHRVEAYRFLRHLSRCEKNHPDKDFVRCPFNHSHMVPREEERHHMANCPDKSRLHMDLQVEVPHQTGDLSLPQRETWHMPDDGSENWDDAVSQNPLLGKLGSEGFQHILPSQRKQRGRSRTEINRWLQNSGQDGNHWIESAGEFGDSRGCGEPKETELRLPHSAPQALQVEPQVAPLSQKQTPTAFNYSMAMAGIGRGTAAKGVGGAAKGVSVNRQLLENLGRGRGRKPNGVSNGQTQTRGSGLVNGASDGETVARPVGRGIGLGSSPTSLGTQSSAQFGWGRGIGRQMTNGVGTSSGPFTIPGLGRGVSRPGSLQNGVQTGGSPQFIIPTVSPSSPAGDASNNPGR